MSFKNLLFDQLELKIILKQFLRRKILSIKDFDPVIDRGSL
tara:strand:+ start:556 stop:678 length:123 start_codon:yes stop_codon:yes gene_type:complete